jgi:sterol desaturase/sphingolipid hydroxylase (fatty acid hydroxylase superfamily)
MAMAITSVILGALVLLEIALPRQSYSLRSRLRGVLFWTVYIPTSAVVVSGLADLWTGLGVKPLVTLAFTQWFAWAGVFKGVLAALAVILVIDFVGYWFHRIQHRALWRFHAVHHAIEEMHAVGSYDHPADIIFGFALVAVPLSLIPFGPGDQPVVLQLLLALQLKFIHSPVRLNFGPLRHVFVDNNYHRIHHSAEPQHVGTNYGTITSVWDRVFGTAYFPAKEEWPQTGLAEVGEPRSLRAFLDLPFRFDPNGRRPPAIAGDAIEPA